MRKNVHLLVGMSVSSSSDSIETDHDSSEGDVSLNSGTPIEEFQENDDQHKVWIRLVIHHIICQLKGGIKRSKNESACVPPLIFTMRFKIDQFSGHLLLFGCKLSKISDIPSEYKDKKIWLIAQDFHTRVINKIKDSWNYIRLDEIHASKKFQCIYKNLGTYTNQLSTEKQYLPKLLKSDPVVRLHFFKIGDLIEIKRPNSKKYFRIVQEEV